MKQKKENSIERNARPGRAGGNPQPVEVGSFSADYRDSRTLPLGKAPVEGEERAQREAEAAEAAQEMDKELDDFLPEGEVLPEEEFLTKWSEELEEPEISEAPEASAAAKETETSGALGEGESVLGNPAGLSPRANRPRGRHWYGLFTGSLVLLLALTGVVFLAWLAGSSLHARLTDDSQLRAYDTFLTPAVMLDPSPFSSPDKAQNDFIQEASLWKAILEDGGSQYTQYDDNGRVIVPLGDVAAACVALFGPERNLSPKTPAEETFFTYDETDNSYHVALFSSDGMVTPYTEKEYAEEGKTVLRVGYVSPADQWRSGASSGTGAPSPTKYMEYVLAQNPDTNSPYIYAVREPETP